MTEAAMPMVAAVIPECMRASDQPYNIDAGIRGVIAKNPPLGVVKPRTGFTS